MLNYWKYLKINKKGLVVKATNSVEQILFPKQFKKFVFEELHNKIGHLDSRELGNYVKMVSTEGNIPGDTGRKLNVHKTFRRRPGCLLNTLCTFNLSLVSTEMNQLLKAHPQV